MIYYALTIFFSAFLLFQIQPLIGKYILPWFGGTPAVWSTTMLFFQTLLTGGYAYAYWLIGKLDEKKQGHVHISLLGFSIGLLIIAGFAWSSPITPDASWKPHGVDFPVGDIFKILAVSVGLPYFLLATNSPLMQAWFNRSYPGRSPYRLYALSNVGSLLALVSYPFLIEPTLTLQTQGMFWSIGFGAFAVFAAYGALKTMRRTPATISPPSSTDVISSIETAPPTIRQYALWIALAACASILLLATTSQITQEVAVIPFLWVLPLTIYLLTFILCFDSERWYSRPIFTLLFFGMCALYVLVLAKGPRLGILVQVVIYSALLFVGCMICHGELVRLKPAPRYLTSFYLMISIGGAIGGIAVSLIAPFIFKGYWELQIGLLICALLLLTATLFNRHSTTLRATRNLATILVGAIVLLVGVVLLSINATTSETLYAARNFYGVLRVNEINTDRTDLRAYRLVHGAIGHGWQYQAIDKRRVPTSYYTEPSGIGLTLLNLAKRNSPIRVGVLGLGIGVLTCYGKPGDVFRFYEINPDVIRLAQGAGGYFTFLKDSLAEIQIVPGDARISLEQELQARQPQHFDVLIVDVFNGDSIPTHLITREAFQIYLRHLQPDGIIALHISNNYLDLRPVVYKVADELGLGVALIENYGDAERGNLSIWALVTRNREFLEQPAIAAQNITRPDNLNRFRPWTDDYSNLFQILR